MQMSPKKTDLDLSVDEDNDADVALFSFFKMLFSGTVRFDLFFFSDEGMVFKQIAVFAAVD